MGKMKKAAYYAAWFVYASVVGLTILLSFLAVTTCADDPTFMANYPSAWFLEFPPSCFVLTVRRDAAIAIGASLVLMVILLLRARDTKQPFLAVLGETSLVGLLMGVVFLFSLVCFVWPVVFAYATLVFAIIISIAFLGFIFG